MNPGSQAAAGPSQPAVTGQQLGQPPYTAASVDSYPRRNELPVHQLERKKENDRAYRKRIKVIASARTYMYIDIHTFPWS